MSRRSSKRDGVLLLDDPEGLVDRIGELSAIREIVQRLGATVDAISPRDVMLMAMRHALRIGRVYTAARLARDVAPYIHPRLESISVADAKSAHWDGARSEEELRAELDDIIVSEKEADRARALAAALQNGTDGVVSGGAAEDSGPENRSWGNSGRASRSALH